jgi:F-type H+-transporting ATPase subunit epsilon
MADLFKVKIVSPDRVFYENDVTMVEFTTTEGQLGICRRYEPTTVIIEPGVLTLHEDGDTKVAALHSGFAEILPESVTILAELVEWPKEIDGERAASARERAEERLRTRAAGIDLVRAEAAFHRAIARIGALK